MYISFDEYKNLGGKISEDEFNAQEPRAEMMIDNWTLNRLRVQEVWNNICKDHELTKVKLAMVYLIDQMPAIEKARQVKAQGGEVTSFNNGVNSFSFGGTSTSTEATTAESSAYYEVCRLLPVEIMSSCVAYNHAN